MKRSFIQKKVVKLNGSNLMSKLLYPLALLLLLSPPVFAEENLFEILRSEQAMRLQEPERPFPYLEEEVLFENPSDGVKLAGTLTLPKTKGPFPAVVLLHGSAPLDRDSAMFGHKFFLVWADYLTQQGIAVLRFDKRSAGKSTGSYETANIEDFAGDAIAAVNYLKTRKQIDQIGLVGISEGGMTAALAASRSNDVAFMVSASGSFVSWKDLLATQGALFMRTDGVSEEIIDHNRKLLSQLFTIEETEKNPEQRLRETITSSRNALTPEQRQVLEFYYGSIEDQVKFWNAKWFRYYFTYDQVATLKQLKIPLLALYGSLDTFVPSEPNRAAMIKALQEVNHQDYTVVELPMLNHLLQTCRTGSIKEIAALDETASPEALKMMADWILKNHH
jgi:uncharacterized protein